MGDAVLGFGLALAGTTVASLLAAVLVAAASPGFAGALRAGSTDDIVAAVEDVALSGPVLLASLLGLWGGFLWATFRAARLKGSGSARKDFSLTFRWFPDLRTGLLLAAGLRVAETAIIAGLVAAGADMSQAENTSAITSQDGVWLVLMLLGAAVGAPIVEEVFFRGLFLRAALRRMRSFGAIALTSAAFGLMHVQATGFVPSAFIVCWTGAIGAVLAYTVIKTGRIGPAVFAHVAFNSSGVILALTAS